MFGPSGACARFRCKMSGGVPLAGHVSNYPLEVLEHKSRQLLQSDHISLRGRLSESNNTSASSTSHPFLAVLSRQSSADPTLFRAWPSSFLIWPDIASYSLCSGVFHARRDLSPCRPRLFPFFFFSSKSTHEIPSRYCAHK